MAKFRLSQDGVEQVIRTMQHYREWICKCPVKRTILGETGEHEVTEECGARLKIRAKDDRSDAKSNYAGIYPPNHPEERLRGHSIVPTGLLNWKGLAEERGWEVEPEVKCPACQVGLSLIDYKKARREGKL